ncbi:hypothetical protein ADUPG1_000351, partial [Aduncisulcus paluster]
MDLIKCSSGVRCATFKGSFLEDRHLATGHFDGRINTWDLNYPQDLPVFSAKGHSSLVYAIDGVAGKNPHLYGHPELVTGGEDGKVCVWDVRLSRPIATLAALP